MMNSQVPTQFRLRRLAQGLRLRDLEQLTDIPESSLSRIERGEQVPTFRQLERLGSALSIDPAQARRELCSRGAGLPELLAVARALAVGPRQALDDEDN